MNQDTEELTFDSEIYWLREHINYTWLPTTAGDREDLQL